MKKVNAVLPGAIACLMVCGVLVGCSSDDNDDNDDAPTSTVAPAESDPPDDGNGALDGDSDDGNGALDGDSDDGNGALDGDSDDG